MHNSAGSRATHVAMICDAGSHTGVGHVMRSLALAEELIGRGVDVSLLADLGGLGWVTDQVDRCGVALYGGARDAASALREIRELDPDAVVVDSYVLPPGLYGALRSDGRVVLAITDGDPGGREAEFYVDQNIGAERDVHQLQPGAHRLAGLDVTLLRSSVLEHRPPAPRGGSSSPVEVLAFFGGTDAFGVAPRVTQTLVDTGVSMQATVVAATPELRNRVEAVVAGSGQRITVAEPGDGLPARIATADVVVSAAGTSTWELFCLGAATAFVCVADNQRVSYERIVGSGLGVGLGGVDDLGDEIAVTALRDLLENQARQDELRAACWSQVDGAGRRRVADALLGATTHVRASA